VWHTFELPYHSGTSGRTKLLFDNHDTAFLILPDARIAAATAEHGWEDWRIVWGAEDVDNVSELIYDRQRLQHDGVLSVAYQETSTGQRAVGVPGRGLPPRQANAAATHDVPDVSADAIRLVITGSYDAQFPPDTGNVQVAEVAVAP
jgi:hypothetical protein